MGSCRSLHHLYTLYRYGEPRKITLAGVPSTLPSDRTLRGVRRRHVVEKVTEILKEWRSSPFQHEAAARAGVRAGLCLEGCRWAKADLEAELIVAEGLRLIGAERPTWEDGQRRYVDRGDFCARCGRPMPDELVSGRRAQRFCSAECAAAELVDRQRKDSAMGGKVTRAAQSLVRREALPQSLCARCGQPFRPLNPGHHGKQRFCSSECFAASRVIHPEIRCLACGKSFRTRVKGGGRTQKFCSEACKNGYGRTVEYSRICEACGASFVTKAPNGRFCSPSCKTFESKHTRGVYAHNALSLRLFDYLFTAPIALAPATPHVAPWLGGNAASE
jgi:hypothetical protein